MQTFRLWTDSLQARRVSRLFCWAETSMCIPSVYLSLHEMTTHDEISQAVSAHHGIRYQKMVPTLRWYWTLYFWGRQTWKSMLIVVWYIFVEHNHTPSGWSAGDNCIQRRQKTFEIGGTNCLYVCVSRDAMVPLLGTDWTSWLLGLDWLIFSIVLLYCVFLSYCRILISLCLCTRTILHWLVFLAP